MTVPSQSVAPSRTRRWRAVVAAAVVVPALAACQPVQGQVGGPAAGAPVALPAVEQPTAGQPTSEQPTAESPAALPAVGSADAPAAGAPEAGTPAVDAPAAGTAAADAAAAGTTAADAAAAGTGPADAAAAAHAPPVEPSGRASRQGRTPPPVQGSAAATTTAAGTAPAAGANPLAGATFHGANAGAAAAAASWTGSPADAAALADLAAVPTATWLGEWSGDVTAAVRSVVARAAGAVPVFVVYALPGRDCGGHSAGGLASPADYAGWVQDVAEGIGSARAVVVVEPDALAQLCGDAAATTRMLDAAVDVLEANPGTATYLDAGHAQWVDAATMAARLSAAGVGDADGFALNVSNFRTTADNVAYGSAVSAALGGARFVVDTSRNGNGPGTDWCNPPGRAVGERPTADSGHPLVDALLWVKQPGESDGTCNGGPAAGAFWPEYALSLVRGGR